MPEKLKKFAVVIFLTILIWALAFLADKETVTVSGTLDVFPQTSKNLLVTFDRDAPIPLRLELEGPAAKIAELDRRLRAEDSDEDKERLDFYYSPEIQKSSSDEPVTTTEVDVPLFIAGSAKLTKLSLTVEKCDIKKVKVTIERLIEKHLPVQCLDENETVLAHKSIDPATVKFYVPRNWSGEMLKANVSPTADQIEAARKAPIQVPSYINLAGKRVYGVRVKISLPSVEEALKSRIVQPTIGYQISPKLQGKYVVDLINADEITDATQIKATNEAWAEYKEKTLYQVLIDVRDDDEKTQGETIARPVIYNFPQEYVRTGEIQLTQEPRIAKFKLIGVSSQPGQ